MKWINQCQDLWGEKWKSTLALTSGVKKRQVFRWYAGTTNIPPRVVEAIDETWNVWKDKKATNQSKQFSRETSVLGFDLT